MHAVLQTGHETLFRFLLIPSKQQCEQVQIWHGRFENSAEVLGQRVRRRRTSTGLHNGLFFAIKHRILGDPLLLTIFYRCLSVVVLLNMPSARLVAGLSVSFVLDAKAEQFRKWH